MAGVTDSTFRCMARKYGAALVFTELVSADGLIRRNRRTLELISFQEGERPVGIQIFGNDPKVMAVAAKTAEEIKPDLIDLNFGCPARKVVGRGAGAALLREPGLLGAIAGMVVKAVNVPVTAKIRSGWNDDLPVAVEAAHILEQEGLSAVTIHPRSRKMEFSGKADWSLIRAVKEAVSIPVIGNGDVLEPEDGKRMLDETGCDLVMVGRGAMGRPWIFRELDHFLNTGQKTTALSIKERMAVCIEHYLLVISLEGKERGVKPMRKHLGWYLKGLPGSSSLKQEIFKLTDPDAVIALLRSYAEGSTGNQDRMRES